MPAPRPRDLAAARRDRDAPQRRGRGAHEQRHLRRDRRRRRAVATRSTPPRTTSRTRRPPASTATASRFARRSAAAKSRRRRDRRAPARRAIDSQAGALTHDRQPARPRARRRRLLRRRRPHSGPRYTRAGNFQLDDQRNLVTADGIAVRGEGGAPINVPPDAQAGQRRRRRHGQRRRQAGRQARARAVRAEPDEARGRHAVRGDRQARWPATRRRCARGMLESSQRQRRARRRRSREGVAHLRVADARSSRAITTSRAARRASSAHPSKEGRTAMFRSLATAASGMEAQQTKLDVTANNIANVSTNGFKKGRAEFADLMYQTAARRPARRRATARNAPSGDRDRPRHAARRDLARRSARASSTRPATRSTSRSRATATCRVTLPNGDDRLHAQRRAADRAPRASSSPPTATRSSATSRSRPTRTSVTIAADGTVSATVAEPDPADRARQDPDRDVREPRRASRRRAARCSARPSASGTAVLGAPGRRRRRRAAPGHARGLERQRRRGDDRSDLRPARVRDQLARHQGRRRDARRDGAAPMKERRCCRARRSSRAGRSPRRGRVARATPIRRRGPRSSRMLPAGLGVAHVYLPADLAALDADPTGRRSSCRASCAPAARASRSPSAASRTVWVPGRDRRGRRRRGRAARARRRRRRSPTTTSRSNAARPTASRRRARHRWSARPVTARSPPARRSRAHGRRAAAAARARHAGRDRRSGAARSTIRGTGTLELAARPGEPATARLAATKTRRPRHARRPGHRRRRRSP